MANQRAKSKRTLSAWIDGEKRDKLRAEAARRNMSVAALLEELIDERVNQIHGEDNSGDIKKSSRRGKTKNKVNKR